MQSNQPLKILILSMEYSPEISGGVGTHVQELSVGLSRNGDRVAVVACTVGKSEKIIEKNRIVYLIPPTQPASSSMAASSMTQGILAFNKDLVSYSRQTVFAEWETPDVIQCYNWLTFPAAYELGQSLHVPVVSTIQFVSEPSERWWGQIPDPEIVEQETIAFRNADRLITVSHSMQSIVQSTHGLPRPENPCGLQRDGYRSIWKEQCHTTALNQIKSGHSTRQRKDSVLRGKTESSKRSFRYFRVYSPGPRALSECQICFCRRA